MFIATTVLIFYDDNVDLFFKSYCNDSGKDKESTKKISQQRNLTKHHNLVQDQLTAASNDQDEDEDDLNGVGKYDLEASDNGHSCRRFELDRPNQAVLRMWK